MRKFNILLFLFCVLLLTINSISFGMKKAEKEAITSIKNCNAKLEENKYNIKDKAALEKILKKGRKYIALLKSLPELSNESDEAGLPIRIGGLWIC